MRFLPGMDPPDSHQLFSDDKFFEVAEGFGQSYSSVSNSSTPSSNHDDNENVKDNTKIWMPIDSSLAVTA